MKIRICVFAFLITLVACADDRTPSMTDEIQLNGLPEPFDLMTPEAIKAHLPVGDKELRSHESVLDKQNDKSNGRYWMWMPDENIRDVEVDGYLQTNAHGVVYVRVEHNPGATGNWAEAQLSNLDKASGNSVAPPGVNTLSLKYEPVEGIGLEAYYSNRVSQLKFRVNKTHLFTLNVEYPLPKAERLEITRKLAYEIIKNLQNPPAE